MSTTNYPAIFVTLSMVCLLIVRCFVPSAILTVLLVVLLPLALTAGVFDLVEYHRRKNSLTTEDAEEIEEDPDYDHYAATL